MFELQSTGGYRLLEMTALTGEFPAASLGRLVGESRYKEKIITHLKTQRLLKTYYQDGLRSYRLTAGGRALLLEEDPVRFGPLLKSLPQMRSDLTRRRRLHQMCEIYLSMKLSGVAIFPDEKAPLFSNGFPSAGNSEPPLPAYYSSREVKAIGIESTKIKNARFCGVLLTESMVYLCYNAGESIMRWTQKSEIKTRALIAYLVCRELLPGRYPSNAVQGIVFGPSPGTALPLLQNKVGKSERAFRLDQTFDQFHFIPQSVDGDMLLRLLTDDALAAKLRSTLSSGLLPADPGAPIENNGFEEDGTPVLFAFDGDLQRLSNFVQMLQLRKSQGAVFCFDFQANAFKQYGGDRLTIRTIDTTKFRRHFLPSQKEIT